MTPLPCVLETLGIRGEYVMSTLHPFHLTFPRHPYGQVVSPHIDIFQRKNYCLAVVGADAGLDGVLDVSVLGAK